MTYYSSTALYGLGQDDEGTVAEKCLDEVKGADLDTKSGREEAFKTGAECAADGYCASYGVPPGICGPIAGWIAEGITDVWNDIFGNEEEWEAYRERQAAHAAWNFARTKASVADAIMACALYKTAAQLADLWDTMVPEKKGVWGRRVLTGAAGTDFGTNWVTTIGPEIVVCDGVNSPARNSMMFSWLAVNGMQHVGLYRGPYGDYEKPLIRAQAEQLPLAQRPAFVQKQIAEYVPAFMQKLGETAARFGAMVAGVVAKREAERAAANKKAWMDAEAANALIEKGDYDGAVQVMQASPAYATAAEIGRRRTFLLNAALLVGGTGLLGAAWYFGRKR